MGNATISIAATIDTLMSGLVATTKRDGMRIDFFLDAAPIVSADASADFIVSSRDIVNRYAASAGIRVNTAA